MADLQNNPNPDRTWKTIKSLSVPPSSTIFAEPLLHKSHLSTNAFMKKYSSVNNKEERECIRQLKATLNFLAVGEGGFAAFAKGGH